MKNYNFFIQAEPVRKNVHLVKLCKCYKNVFFTDLSDTQILKSDKTVYRTKTVTMTYDNEISQYDKKVISFDCSLER